MSFTKLPAIESFQHCNVCPPRPQELPLDAALAIGFGSVTVTKGDITVWSGDDPEVRLIAFEQKAKAASDNDWRVTFYGPLYEAEYQRQGEGSWVLVRRGEGFA